MTDKIHLRIDENELTLGDLEDFEDAVGKSLMDALKQTPVKDDEDNFVFDDKGRKQMQVNVSAKALKALVWITQRKTNPEFTLDDARNVRVAALELVEDDSAKSEGQGNDESGEPLPEGAPSV